MSKHGKTIAQCLGKFICFNLGYIILMVFGIYLLKRGIDINASGVVFTGSLVCFVSILIPVALHVFDHPEAGS